MMTVALHNRIIGKPGKFRGLQRFVEYGAPDLDAHRMER